MGRERCLLTIEETCLACAGCGRFKAALEKKNMKKQAERGSLFGRELQADAASDAAAAGFLSQRSTPVKGPGPLAKLLPPDASDLTAARQDVQRRTQTQHPRGARKILPCLLLVSCCGLVAALFALFVLPKQPQVLPLIY